MSDDSPPKTVRKAVIAAAGFGTRFLPQTKAMPKEMLPLVDKPIIQYIVEELVDSGITDILIVTNYHKRTIEDHFDTPNAELANILTKGGKHQQLDSIRRIAESANIAYVRQKELLGNLGPVYYAQDWIGNEPFIYAFGDDFISAKPLRFKQMIDAHSKHDASIVSCVEVGSDVDYDRYGIVGGEKMEDNILRMKVIKEKPGKAEAPSNWASVSGYLFKPDIFRYVNEEKANNRQGVETQIQPAIQRLADETGEVLALKIENGKFYDSGNKLEYLKTIVDFALMHDELKDDFQEFLRDRITKTK